MGKGSTECLEKMIYKKLGDDISFVMRDKILAMRVGKLREEAALVQYVGDEDLAVKDIEEKCGKVIFKYYYPNLYMMYKKLRKKRLLGKEKKKEEGQKT